MTDAIHGGIVYLDKLIDECDINIKSDIVSDENHREILSSTKKMVLEVQKYIIELNKIFRKYGVTEESHDVARARRVKRENEGLKNKNPLSLVDMAEIRTMPFEEKLYCKYKDKILESIRTNCKGAPILYRTALAFKVKNKIQYSKERIKIII